MNAKSVNQFVTLNTLDICYVTLLQFYSFSGSFDCIFINILIACYVTMTTNWLYLISLQPRDLHINYQV